MKASIKQLLGCFEVGKNTQTKLLYSALILFATIPSVSYADDYATNLEFDLKVASIMDTTGTEIGLGASKDFGKINLSLTGGGFIHQKNNGRYRLEQYSTGDICRDTTNGYFAKDELCNPDIDAYAKFQAGLSLTNKFEIGVGYLYNNLNSSPYGNVGIKFSPRFILEISAGKDYQSGGLRFRF